MDSFRKEKRTAVKHNSMPCIRTGEIEQRNFRHLESDGHFEVTINIGGFGFGKIRNVCGEKFLSLLHQTDLQLSEMTNENLTVLGKTRSEHIPRFTTSCGKKMLTVSLNQGLGVLPPIGISHQPTLLSAVPFCMHEKSMINGCNLVTRQNYGGMAPAARFVISLDVWRLASNGCLAESGLQVAQLSQRNRAAAWVSFGWP